MRQIVPTIAKCGIAIQKLARRRKSRRPSVFIVNRYHRRLCCSNDDCGKIDTLSLMTEAANPHPHLVRGLVIMAVAMTILPCMDAIAKYMSTFHAMSPAQVTFYRFFFQMVLTVPLLLTVAGGWRVPGEAAVDEPAAGRAACGGNAAVFHRRQVHAAR
jgi:hypothetical protein